MREFFILFFPLLFSYQVKAQTSLDTVEIAVNKTVQFIFDAQIIPESVDVGSPYISAVVVGNQLKVYAKESQFYPTNMSLQTYENGKKYYYMYILTYDEYTLDLFKRIENNSAIYIESSNDSENKTGISKKEHNSYSKKGSINLPLTNEISLATDKVYQLGATYIPPLGQAFSNRMQMTVDAIYENGENVFIRVNLKNNSNIVYDIDLINFSIRPKGGGKRSVGDATGIPILYPEVSVYEESIRGNELYKKVFAFNKFTFGKKERLFIEFREKNGDRNLRIEIKLKDYLKAASI